MKRLASLVVIAAAGLALAACAPDKGTVAARRAGMSCTYRTPKGICAAWAYKYELEVVDPGQRDPVYTDRPLSGWVDVTKQEYSRCPNGSAYPKCKDGAA